MEGEQVYEQFLTFLLNWVCLFLVDPCLVGFKGTPKGLHVGPPISDGSYEEAGHVARSVQLLACKRQCDFKALSQRDLPGRSIAFEPIVFSSCFASWYFPEIRSL